MLTRRQVITSAIGTFALGSISGCQTSGAASGKTVSLARPIWRVGERWGYQVIDGFNSSVLSKPFYRVAKVADTSGDSIEIESDNVVVERYNKQLQALAENCFAEPVQYNLPVDWLAPEGKAVSTESSTRYPNNSTPSHFWRQSVVVQGYESVTVPAGTFNCAVIQRTIYFQHPDSFRLRSERVDRLWYAPEVRRWVQRDVRGSYLDSSDIDDRGGGTRRSEIWRIWQLLTYTSPPVAG